MTEKATPVGAHPREIEALLLHKELAKLFRAWLLGQEPEVQDLLSRLYIEGRTPSTSRRDELRRIRALNQFRRVALAWICDQA